MDSEGYGLRHVAVGRGIRPLFAEQTLNVRMSPEFSRQSIPPTIGETTRPKASVDAMGALGAKALADAWVA